MTLNEAKAAIGHNVRIAPQAHRTLSSNQHKKPGKITGVTKRGVTVHLFGSGELDGCDPRHLKIWHAREPQAPVVIPSAAQRLEKSVNNNAPTLKPAAAPVAPVDPVPEPVAAAPSPAAKPNLSEVLGDLTNLLAVVKLNEADLATAEKLLDEATAAKVKAEARVMEVMGNLETTKSRVRKARASLDGVLEGV